LTREEKETVAYLEEVLADYERFVNNIGDNGMTAPMLLYYRDEVQDTLDYLTESTNVETQDYWMKVVACDRVLNDRAQEFVEEVGHANFKQYQIINDPPREYWWWYLNRETRSPKPPPAFWQFWKK
jgi:hypothetical protein